jgi:hypothetical protein
MAFSIKHLLVVFLFAALGLAALLNAHLPIVAELADLITLLTIVLIGYGVWISDGELRAFRIGFVCWAGTYFIATKWFSIAFNIATGKVLQIIKWPLEPRALQSAGRTGEVSGPIEEEFLNAQGRWMDRFDTIGHCLFALLFGLVGGWVTVYFYRKRQRMRHTKI